MTPSQLSPEDLQALVETSKELSKIQSTDRVLDLIMGQAMTLTQSTGASIYLYNEERHSLFFAAVYGEKAEGLLKKFGEESEEQIPLTGSIAGRCFTEANVIIVNETKTDPDHYKKVDESTHTSTESTASAPLISDGKTLGVMQVLNKQGASYGIHDARLLEEFAHQATSAILHSRLIRSLLAHVGFYSSAGSEAGLMIALDRLKGKAANEYLTIMFADMRGFTTLCQTLASAEDIQSYLNQFLNLLSDQVEKYDGVVNKFIGDGMLAFFRGEEHEQCASRCAFAIAAAVERLRSQWEDASNNVLSFIDVGIGIVTDSVIVGPIGSRKVRDFTAIGTPVNLASSFETTARGGARIVCDHLTFKKCAGLIKKFEGPLFHELKKPDQSWGKSFRKYSILAIDDESITRVFISCVNSDYEFVQETIIGPLAERGIDAWFAPSSIMEGDQWPIAIGEGLMTSNAMIIAVSPTTPQSEWVKREVSAALSLDHLKNHVVPLLLKGAVSENLRDVNPLLFPIQAIDLRIVTDVAERIVARLKSFEK